MAENSSFSIENVNKGVSCMQIIHCPPAVICTLSMLWQFMLQLQAANLNQSLIHMQTHVQLVMINSSLMTTIDQLMCSVTSQKMAMEVPRQLMPQQAIQIHRVILVINQAICILERHSLCPMKFQLKGMHISEVPKFLTESPSVTTHAIQLPNPFDVAHPLIILLQLSRVTNYFALYSPSTSEYENEDILKIYLC